MINENILKKIGELLLLFIIGGATYVLIEILWRGYSHSSMFIVGGLCFIIIGSINNYFPWDLGMVQQTLIACGIITALEFIAGLIFNVWLGLGVWDYSDQPFNLMGQICLLYSVLWLPLAVFAIVLDDWARHFLFGEEKPRYKLI